MHKLDNFGLSDERGFVRKPAARIDYVELCV